ncbi:AAA family ATPase [Desulfitobacterium hafniense]|uniref:AAA family ATPase n=1 Tax=Desulfitobacterium hafniense TaxID=49338 RepID=UPI000377F768|nr:ATP-binding protein [Desulfitobacterium hafniense]
MARADLLYELIKYGLNNDNLNFRKVAETICAEERAKQHGILASKIEEILKTPYRPVTRDISGPHIRNGNGEQSLFIEKIPLRKLEQLLLPKPVLDSCRDVIEEQTRADLLRTYGLEPRNKILLVGPPGNGKTSLAEALAEALMLPFLTVKYESIVGAYLGETAARLGKLFDYAKTRQCVLFFDEFETLGKERGDTHETGEIKRVVSSLLLQIDALPSYVIVIAATNHDALLDRAAWRRFQLRLSLPKPSRRELEMWFAQFEKHTGFDFGLEPSTLAKKFLGKSYAEAEEFALAVYRKYILRIPEGNAKTITQTELNLYFSGIQGNRDKNQGEEGDE